MGSLSKSKVEGSSNLHKSWIFSGFSSTEHFDTDIGTEELAHQEMIAAIVYQLTRNLTPEQIKAGGFGAYFVDHTTGIYPQSASGMPFSAATLQSTGDPLTDLFEDLAADAARR